MNNEKKQQLQAFENACLDAWKNRSTSDCTVFAHVNKPQALFLPNLLLVFALSLPSPLINAFSIATGRNHPLFF